MPLFHAIDPNDGLFCHNIQIGYGRVTAVSYARAKDANLANMVSPYEAYGSERKKEAAFEKVRQASFPNCPPRLGSLYLFSTQEMADKANAKWWSGKRVILRAGIVAYSRMAEFDAAHLDTSEEDWAAAGRRYWSGDFTADPMLEFIVEGVIQLQCWEPYGRIGGY